MNAPQAGFSGPTFLPAQVADYLARRAVARFGGAAKSYAWLSMLGIGLLAYAAWRFQGGSIEDAAVSGGAAIVLHILHVQFGINKAGLTWGSLFSRNSRDTLFSVAESPEVLARVRQIVPPELWQLVVNPPKSPFNLIQPKPMNTTPATPEDGAKPSALTTILQSPPLASLTPRTLPLIPDDTPLSEEELASLGKALLPDEPHAPAPAVRPVRQPVAPPTTTGPVRLSRGYDVGSAVMVTPNDSTDLANVSKAVAGKIVALSRDFIIVRTHAGDEVPFNTHENRVWSLV